MDRRDFLKTAAVTTGATLIGGVPKGADALADASTSIQRYSSIGSTGIRMSDISFGTGKLPSPSLAERAFDAAVVLQPRLIIMDFKMPRMSGPDLLRELRKKKADLPALFMSGYSFESMKGEDVSNSPFLQKPFHPRDRRREVARLTRVERKTAADG